MKRVMSCRAEINSDCYSQAKHDPLLTLVFGEERSVACAGRRLQSDALADAGLNSVYFRIQSQVLYGFVSRVGECPVSTCSASHHIAHKSLNFIHYSQTRWTTQSPMREGWKERQKHMQGCQLLYCVRLQVVVGNTSS